MSEKYDEVLQKLLKVDGEWTFVEKVFSFLRRKTSLLGSTSWQRVQELATKQVQLYAKENAKMEVEQKQESEGDKQDNKKQDRPEKLTDKINSDSNASKKTKKNQSQPIDL